LKLLAKGRLKLPKKIAIPEIFLSLFLRFIFVALVCLTFVLLVYYPIPVIIFLSAIGLVGLLPKTRVFVVQGILDQFILLYAVFLIARKKKFITWEHTRY